MLNKNVVYYNVFIIMCRDTVELAKRARYKPPAMRVRGKGYTKKSPFVNIIRVFTKERKVILWQIKKIVYLTLNGCVNTT